jgi:pimeloyl-ACP methyl ester carboxylesterase
MVRVTSRDPATARLLRAMIEANRGIFRMRHWPVEPMDPPAWERLGALRNPVLFVVGEDDTPLVRRVVDATAERIPQARKTTVPGADHLPQMTRPAEVNRLVLEFLGEPEAGE